MSPTELLKFRESVKELNDKTKLSGNTYKEIMQVIDRLLWFETE